MRGEEDLKQEEQAGDTIVPVTLNKSRNRLIAANIVDPKDGTVHFHIVSTKWVNIAVVTISMLLLCGLVVLAMVVWLKISIDENSGDIQKLEQSAPVSEETQK